MDLELEQLGIAADRVEWRAQLVAHHGEEFALRPVGCFGVDARALGDRQQLLPLDQCVVPRRDIDSHDDDAPGRVRCRREGVIQQVVVVVDWPRALRVEAEHRVGPHERYAGVVHVVEDSLGLRSGEVGKHLDEPLAAWVAPPDDLLIFHIRHGVAQFAPVDHGDRDGRGSEHARKVGPRIVRLSTR